MNTKTTFLFGALSFGLLSFTRPGAHTPRAMRAGTYGVCGSAGQNSSVSLDINTDRTFHYVNNAEPAKAWEVTGTWEAEGNKVVLHAAEDPNGVFGTWSMDKDHDCLRSRQGLLFTRLCLLEDSE